MPSQHTIYEAGSTVRVVAREEGGLPVMLTVLDDALDKEVKSFPHQKEIQAKLFADAYAEGRYVRRMCF